MVKEKIQIQDLFIKKVFMLNSISWEYPFKMPTSAPPALPSLFPSISSPFSPLFLYMLLRICSLRTLFFVCGGVRGLRREERLG